VRRTKRSRRHGPFDRRWPRRDRASGGDDAVENGQVALSRPVDELQRRRLLKSCARSIDALHSYSDPGAQRLVSRLETLEATVRLELGGSDASRVDPSNGRARTPRL
jgi:hypothetical protein